jgi:RHS repeat-associated protein
MSIDAEERRPDAAAGNRTSKTGLQQADPTPVSVVSEYSYDNIYQLTQTLVDQSLAESYTYDAVGNRLTSISPPSYTYNSSNQLTPTSAATYTYDYNGNTLSKTDTNGTTYYTWDYENRLTQVTLPGEGGTVYFNYDPFGRRIRKVLGSATTIYAYDGDNVIEELNASGNLVASYTQGAGIEEPLAMYRGLTTSYFHADGLGSITSLTEGAGNVSASYVYDSFGKLTASTGSLTNPFQYTGREFDSETGLYYYRARYYDAGAGRFLSEDPLGYLGGRNFYAYVGNLPTTLFDPLGLKPCEVPWVPKDPKLRKAPALTRCPSQSLVDCLISAESNGNPSAVSPKGAEGKWQVTPSAVAELQQQSLIGDKYDLDEVGMLYLKYLLTFCDTTENALAAYNAGYDAVNRAGGVPNNKETPPYVKKIGDCLVKKGLAKGLEDTNATTCCDKSPRP